MRQQRYQRGMVRLSRRITRLENEVNQAMAVMDADTVKLLNYRQLMRRQRSMEPVISQRIRTISKWHWWQNKKSHQHH
jgi:hypothetical protein